MAMECLAQELIDGIIDRVPLEHLQFCSLVARRWLRRSQQGLFERVAYKSEDLAYRWHTRIPQDPEGIPSYVRSVQVQDLTHCREPGMLHSILRCFANLTSLDLGRIDLSLLSEPGNPTLFGHFWRKLANLSINNTTCTYGTLVPLILSFPSLERLLLSRLELGGTPLSTLPDTPKRVSQALWVHGGCQNVLMTLARFPFSFRTITVARAPSDVPPSGDLRALLAASSGIVEKVTMCDMKYHQDNEAHPGDLSPDLPSLVALRHLHVMALGSQLDAPPTWLINLLIAITAPELSAVHLEFGTDFGETPVEVEKCASDHRWILVDKWLARLARARGRRPILEVVLWISFDRIPPKLGNLLSESRGAGVEVRVGSHVGP